MDVQSTMRLNTQEGRMQGVRTTVADPLTEARERLNIVSFLEEVRGTIEPDKQKILDGMSAVLAGARGAQRLYEQYSQQTSDPTLKKKWQEFGKGARVHTQIAERVIGALGGAPSYRSPVAKELDKLTDCMLKVDAQGDAGDLARLGNLVMAEHICRLQCRGVNDLARKEKDPAMAKIFWDASRIAERDEEVHVRWNTAMYESQFMKVAAGV